MDIATLTRQWDKAKKQLKYVYPLLLAYLMWWFLHYISVHLYVRYCVPLTLIGFVYSPLMSQFPHCYILRWFIDKGGLK